MALDSKICSERCRVRPMCQGSPPQDLAKKKVQLGAFISVMR